MHRAAIHRRSNVGVVPMPGVHGCCPKGASPADGRAEGRQEGTQGTAFLLRLHTTSSPSCRTARTPRGVAAHLQVWKKMSSKRRASLAIASYQAEQIVTMSQIVATESNPPGPAGDSAAVVSHRLCPASTLSSSLR